MDTVTAISLGLAVLALIVGILVQKRTQWKETLADWTLPVVDTVFRRGIRILETRSGFWEKNIQSIVSECDELVVLDSYQGHKHKFWRALETRLSQPERFHLIYLILREGDPILQRCLGIIGAPENMTEIDRGLISNLKVTKEESPWKHNKTLEFYYWEGVSPGPLLSWKKGGKEKIGLGFWVHLREATDGTPYLVVNRGPLFGALKRHYEAIIKNARENPECYL